MQHVSNILNDNNEIARIMCDFLPMNSPLQQVNAKKGLLKSNYWMRGFTDAHEQKKRTTSNGVVL